MPSWGHMVVDMVVDMVEGMVEEGIAVEAMEEEGDMVVVVL